MADEKESFAEEIKVETTEKPAATPPEENSKKEETEPVASVPEETKSAEPAVESKSNEDKPEPTSVVESKPPASTERLRRLPAELVKIKDLRAGMKRVCVAGTVISKNTDLYSFMIDDGEAKVLVLMNDVDRFQKIEISQFVRAFAKIWGEGDEIELQADVVQDFSKIDKELYQKIF